MSESITGIVTNIQRCSTEDGPGIRTTVFFKGCPMSCVWCHNIETLESKQQVVWYGSKCIGDKACIDACPEGALELTEDGMKINRNICKTCGSCEDACPTNAIHVMGKVWEVDTLVEELLRDKIFFTTSAGGVTLSGGEPTYQMEFVIKVAEALRESGVHLALDTCGYCSESALQKTLDVVDMVLFDLKQMNPDRHMEYTGVPLERVLANAKVVGNSGKPVWIRTPIIPNHTDDDENIKRIADFVLKNMPNVERYDLLAFNKMCIDKYALFDLEYPLKDVDLVLNETMERLASIAKESGLSNVVWSGMTKRESEDSSNENQKVVKPCG